MRRANDKSNSTVDALRIPQMDGALDSPVKKAPTTRRNTRTPTRREPRFPPLNVSICKTPIIGATTNDKENINVSNTVDVDKHRAVYVFYLHLRHTFVAHFYSLLPVALQAHHKPGGQSLHNHNNNNSNHNHNKTFHG